MKRIKIFLPEPVSTEKRWIVGHLKRCEHNGRFRIQVKDGARKVSQTGEMYTVSYCDRQTLLHDLEMELVHGMDFHLPYGNAKSHERLPEREAA